MKSDLLAQQAAVAAVAEAEEAEEPPTLALALPPLVAIQAAWEVCWLPGVVVEAVEAAQLLLPLPLALAREYERVEEERREQMVGEGHFYWRLHH